MSEVAKGFRQGRFCNLSDPDKRDILKLMARVAEQAYRRGVQQGVGLAGKPSFRGDLWEWRYRPSLDLSPWVDRFADDLPRLVAVRNRLGRPWTLAPIGADGLREVIEGPARLANLDVSEVKAAMVAEARDEPGALPLVENALHWLWEKRTSNRLSGQLFTEQGGLAGILSRSANDLLSDLAADQRGRALELLFRLVRVDPEGSRHARRRMRFAEAVDVAGGGEAGRTVVNRLAGQRAARRRQGRRSATADHHHQEEAGGGTEGSGGRWVNLIHETLIRSKGLDAAGKPQPYWPTLWDYIEKHKERAAWRERLRRTCGRGWRSGKAPATSGPTSGCGRRSRRCSRSAPRSS